MASYTSQRGPNGGPISPSYSHPLPAPGHAHSTYASSQTLPSMTPSTNGNGGYSGQSYPQSQGPYQHHQSPYQSQQSHQPPHPQAYQQPPPPGPPQHSLPSPNSIAPPQSSSGSSQAVARLDPVSTVVGGRKFSYVTFLFFISTRARDVVLRVDIPEAHVFLSCSSAIN